MLDIYMYPRCIYNFLISFRTMYCMCPMMYCMQTFDCLIRRGARAPSPTTDPRPHPQAQLEVAEPDKMYTLLEKRVDTRQGCRGTAPKGRAVSMLHSGKLLIKHVRQQCTPVHSYTSSSQGLPLTWRCL